MLSYEQFRTKHENKFRRDGLGNAEIRRRYEDYKQSFLANSNGGSEPRRAIIRAPERGLRRINLPRLPRDGYKVERKRMITEYMLSLMDPWNHKAHLPDPLAYKGVPISIKWQSVLKTDDTGAAVLMQRPGIARSYAVSANEDDTPVKATPTSYRNFTVVSGTSQFYQANLDLSSKTDSLMFSAEGNAAKAAADAYPGALGGTGGVEASSWQPIPTWSDVQSTGVAYRVVSGGIRLQYIGPPLTASGTLVLAPYHAGYGLPGDGTGTATFPNVFTFNDITTLEGAETYPAVDGGCITMLPYGDEVKFRPLKAENAFAQGSVTYQGTDIKNVKDWATCDVDVDEYDALWGPGLTCLGVVAPDTMPFTGAAFEPASFPIPTPSGPATFAGFVGMVGKYQDHRLPSDQTSLLAMVAGGDVSTDMYRVEHVLNIEVIPDSRAFSAVSRDSPLSQAPIPETHAKLAGHFAAALPPITDQNTIGSIMHDVAKQIPMAVQTARGIMPHVKKLTAAADIFEVAETIADIIEAVAV